MKQVRNVGQAGMLLTAGSIASAIAKWYLVWLAQRIGGPETLGTYGMILAIATPIFVAAQLGLRTVFLTLRQAYPWKNYLELRFFGLVSATIALLLFLFSSPQEMFYLGLAILSFKIVDSLQDLNVARIQYANRLKVVGWISIVNAIFSIVCSTLIAITTGSFIFAIIGATGSSLVVAVVARHIALKNAYIPETLLNGKRKIVQASFPVTVAELLSTLLLYLPVFVMSLSNDLKIVGVFTGTAYVLTAANLVGASLSKILISPLKHRFKQGGISSLYNFVQKITLFLFVSCGSVSLVFIAFGGPLFETVYGSEFALTYFELSIYSIASVCIILSLVQSVALSVMNKYYAVTAAFIVACIVSLVSGLIFMEMSVDLLMVGIGMSAVGSVCRFIVLWSVLFFSKFRRGNTSSSILN